MFSSPVYSNRVRAFALVNCVLFAAFQFLFAFTPGAWLCAILGAGAAAWYRIKAAPTTERGALRQRGASA